MYQDPREEIRCQHCHSPVKIDNESTSSRKDANRSFGSTYLIDIDSPEKQSSSRTNRLSSDIEKTFDEIANRNRLRSPEKVTGDRAVSITPVSSSRNYQSRSRNVSYDDVNLVNSLINTEPHDKYCPNFSRAPRSQSSGLISTQNTFGSAFDELRSSLTDFRSSVDSVYTSGPKRNADNSDELAKRRPLVRTKFTSPTEDAARDAMDQYHRERPMISTIYRDQNRVSPTPDSSQPGVHCVHCGQNNANGPQNEMEILRNSVSDLCLRLDDLRASVDTRRSEMAWDDTSSVRSSRSKHPLVPPPHDELLSLNSLTARDMQVEQLKKERQLAAERFARDKSRVEESSYAQAIKNERRLADERLAKEEANRAAAEAVAQEKLTRLKADRLAQEEALKTERRLTEEKLAIEQLKLLKAEQHAQEEALKAERRLIDQKTAQEELDRLKTERLAQEEALKNERRLAEDRIAYEELRLLRANRHESNFMKEPNSDQLTRYAGTSPLNERQLTSLAHHELNRFDSESSDGGSLRNEGRLAADRLAEEELKQLETAALETVPLINVRRAISVVKEEAVHGRESESKVETLKPPSASVWLESGDLAFTHSFGPGNMGLRFEFDENIGLNVVTEVKNVAATYGIRVGDYIVQTNEQDLAGYDNFSNGFEGVEVVLEAANALVEGSPGVFSLSDEALCEVLLELSRPLVVTLVRPCDKTKLCVEARQEKAALLEEETRLKEQMRLAEAERSLLEEASRVERERIAAEEQAAEYALMKAELTRKNAFKVQEREKELESQRAIEEEKAKLEMKKIELEKKVQLQVKETAKLEMKRAEEPEHRVHFQVEEPESEDEALERKHRKAREEADLKYKRELEAQIREHELRLQEEMDRQKLEDERYARELQRLEEKKQAQLEEARQARKTRLAEERQQAQEDEAKRARELKELEDRERRAFALLRKKSERERRDLEERLLREQTEEVSRALELRELKEKENRAMSLMQKKLDRDRASLAERQQQQKLQEEQKLQEARVEAHAKKKKSEEEMKLQEKKLAAEKESRAFELMRKKRDRDMATKQVQRELAELAEREHKALALMQQKLSRDRAAKLVEQRVEEERRAEEARLVEENAQNLRDAELNEQREARAVDLLRRKQERDQANRRAKLERERLKREAEEASAAVAAAAAAELVESKERKQKLRERKKLEALELQRLRDEEEEEARRKREEEKEREREDEENIKKADRAKAILLKKLRGNKSVKSVPKSSHSRSQITSQRDFSRLKQKNNSMRMDMIRGLAELRRPLSSHQLKSIDLTSKLVYMWPLEDGNKLTEEVKPWPCKVLKASMVKLTMPSPCGRTYAENEKAWGLVFGSFLNTPGTPFRSQLKYTEDRKLTAGTSYLASAQEAHVIRVPKDGNRDFVDVVCARHYLSQSAHLLVQEYLTDTNGKSPAPGDMRALAALKELEIPVSKVFSKEENQEIFVGAAVRVTKVVQRTFEFVDSTAAYNAVATLLKNTPKRGEDEYGSDTDSEVEKYEHSDDSDDSDSDDSESSMDLRFSLIHGGCRFKVSRPLKVMLDGLEDYHLLLPDTSSVRIASADDRAPQEVPFPASSCWGSNVDPAKVTRWDPKVLKEEGMPLRFVNHRKHCSVVYKVCNLVDIDKPEAPAITAAQTAKHLKRNPKRLMRGESFGISHRDIESDVVMALSPRSDEIIKNRANNEYFHEPLVVYVRPGETAWVKAPPGVYHLRLCEGRKWFGDEYKFGPSSITLKPEAAKAVKGQPPPEPFANYVLSLWRYPNLWLYRSRAGRWLITPEDPSVAITPHDEAPEDDEEEERLRDLYINDVATFRTKKKKLEWPHDLISKGNWERHKGAGCAPADSDDEESVFKIWPLKLWSSFKGMSITVDNEAFSAGTPRSLHRNNSMDPHAGPAAFWVSGLPSIVEDKGAFLRVAHKSNYGRAARGSSEELTRIDSRESRESFGGMSSLEKPFRIHGKPVFRFDPRYDFLRGLYRTPELDEYDDDDDHDEEVLERGRAGPHQGAWWLEMRDSCHDAGTFAKEVLEELDSRGGDDSSFFSTWSASIFEVPDKRIRTVLWPQNS